MVTWDHFLNMLDLTVLITQQNKPILTAIQFLGGGGEGGGEGSQDMDLGEIQELIDTTPEELTEDSLIEMTASKSVPNDEEDGKETVPETNWQYKCGRRFLIIQDYFLPTL